jgi:probable H4MPT-linked C1 transfer pathway protein
VRHIVGAAREAWGAARLRVLCRDGSWRSPREVEGRPAAATAANWRAPAEWLARRGEDVLLADMGSTTTDLVPVRGGEAGTDARTDLERLAAGELVYTGLLRTPVSAMVSEVELTGATVPVAAERFAVAADVHLWLGSLSPGEYRCETPDGGPVTREASGRRLARMVCSEPDELGTDGVDAVARAAAGAQARRIVDAVGRQRRRGGRLPRRALATGAGADLLAAHLRRAGLDLARPPGPLAGEHAAASTATTLALLALEDRP